MAAGAELIANLARGANLAEYRKRNWEGTFEEYLDIVLNDPKVARNAYQRVYDMVLSKGTTETFVNKEKTIRYKFFDDPDRDGQDAIFGLERTLINLVNIFKSAAYSYGTERRVLLLHGPVGSSKSTIARLLKRGLERYSQTDDGALYTYSWVEEGPDGEASLIPCPMNQEPLYLIPKEHRGRIVEMMNANLPSDSYQIALDGELNPFCRHMFNERLKKHGGDWTQVLKEVRVRRLILSEQDRVGIGTFQPKDEKNQDATELTGDINYRKIAEFGSDSDPRCVLAGTRVATNQGLRPIRSMMPLRDDPEPDTFVPTRKITVSTIGANPTAESDSMYYAGVHALKTIETQLGYKLTSTPNHMVLTLTPEGEPAWKEMRLLEVGDYVALGRGVRIWPERDAALPKFAAEFYGNERHRPAFPERMTPALARWLGLWIGDGHLSINEANHQYEIGWTRIEPNRRQAFVDLTREIFGIEARNEERVVRFGSRPIARWLIDVLDAGAKAAAKAIPEAVFASTRESQRACLGGLWETDGTIRNSGGSNWAMFATCSETLARQVHTLLMAFGIVSSLKQTPSNWEVRVYGRNVNVLVELLPELRARYTVGEEVQTVSLPNVDAVPHIKPLLRRIYRAAANREELKRRFSGNLHGKKKNSLSYRALDDFLGLVRCDAPEAQDDLARLRHLARERHAWLRVTSIRDAEPAPAYDLSVAETHAYWADGFITHNCFNFDGEFNVANRGIIEFIEVLKLDVAFLYDLLGASQEHKIKPKKFAQTDIDEVILGHTNEPEYKKLQSNEFMEALRDRTVKIDVPYVTRLGDELRIYEKDYNNDRVRGKRIAPHTLGVAAMWAVLTRLEPPKNAGLTLMQKMKLYNGKTLPGFTEDNIKELRDEAEREGMHGISPRYVQDKISNALVAHPDVRSVNPFMVLNELESGLKHHSLITSEEIRKHCKQLLSVVKEEYEDIVKNEVQRAIAADEDALTRLCGNYIDNVKAYTQREKVRNKYTGQAEEPDERLMRSIEEKIDIPESRKDDFRREIMNYIGALSLDGKKFDYKTNERLQKALELKLFQDQKDTIKLTSLVSNVVDKDTQEKIDIVKSRLIRTYGYDEDSATDVLNFVASIFARGDVKRSGS